MIGLFKTRPLIEDDTRDWLYCCFEWALENFGTDIFYGHTTLVTPTIDFFPDNVEDENQIAQTLFERVRTYSLMSDWEVKLSPQDAEYDAIVAPTVAMQNVPTGPAGTFRSAQNDMPEITYRIEHIAEPEKLIATFAHELAHHLIFSIEEPPPGGDDNMEYATDLMAVFNGFGIFLCNSAFTFSQHTNYDSQGWRTETLGYLSRYELVYALAIFCALKEVTQRSVLPHLDSGLRSFFKKSMKEIAKQPQKLESLKTISSEKRPKKDCDTAAL